MSKQDELRVFIEKVLTNFQLNISSKGNLCNNLYRSYSGRERSLSKERDRSWDSRGGSRDRLGRGGRSSSQERYTTRDRSSSRERGRPNSAGGAYKMAPPSAAGNSYIITLIKLL